MLNILEQLSNIKERLNELGPLPSIEKDILLEKLRELYLRASVIGTREEEPGAEPFELEGTGAPEQGASRDIKDKQPEQKEPDGPEKETGNREEEAEGHKGEAGPPDQEAGVNDHGHGGRGAQGGQDPDDDRTDPDEAPTRVTARPKKPVQGTTLAEKYQGGKNYINEQLARDNEKGDLSAKLKSKPIGDIASAVGINDKYKLVRDLFGGNPDVYEKTIAELNRATNFNEAFKYINDNFDWEMEDESVQLLLDLVRRKFIVDKNG